MDMFQDYCGMEMLTTSVTASSAYNGLSTEASDLYTRATSVNYPAGFFFCKMSLFLNGVKLHSGSSSSMLIQQGSVPATPSDMFAVGGVG